jgi:addiction module HigA family antidote
MSARELARTLKVPTTRITDILRGRRGITGDTALRLGRYFGMSPDFWMNLQKLYELDLARQELGDQLADIPRRTPAVPDTRQPPLPQ